MRSTVFILAAWSTCILTLCAQTLLSALEARPELVLFNDYIQLLPTLKDTLNNVINYTILAPSDTAMTRWLNDSSPPPSQDQIVATLNYHILLGSFSQASFSKVPQFAPSCLTNSSFTNVTGGAVVELSSDAGQNPVAISGLRMSSQIITGDLAADGGLFHIIDSVLAVPQSEPATVIEANLEYYTQIVRNGNFLTGPTSNANNALGLQPETTYFIPNSQAALDNFTSITAGWASDKLDALLAYHAVPGIVAYSSSLQNGTVFPTVQGADITIYAGPNNTIYANNIRILATDYLISNGVMHTIDGVLNPFNITSPAFPESQRAFPVGAIAGIAVGLVALLTSIVVGAFMLCRRRKKQDASREVIETSKRSKASDRKIRKSTIRKMPSEDKSQLSIVSEEGTLDSSKLADDSRRSERRDRHDSHQRPDTHGQYTKRNTATDRRYSKQVTFTKPSHRSSSKDYHEIQAVHMTKYVKQSQQEKEKEKEEEKARVDEHVRSVVAEQLDAFRRSGYIVAPPGAQAGVPTISIDSVKGLDNDPSVARRERDMPAIEEDLELVELAAEDVILPAVELDGKEISAPSHKTIKETLSSLLRPSSGRNSVGETSRRHSRKASVKTLASVKTMDLFDAFPRTPTTMVPEPVSPVSRAHSRAPSWLAGETVSPMLTPMPTPMSTPLPTPVLKPASAAFSPSKSRMANIANARGVNHISTLPSQTKRVAIVSKTTSRGSSKMVPALASEETSRATLFADETSKTSSRASSRAMVLDRR